MSVRLQNRINVKIGLIRSFPRIPFIYMSLLSPLAITCKIWVNSEGKKLSFIGNRTHDQKFQTN